MKNGSLARKRSPGSGTPISNLKQINLVKKQDNLLSKLLILRSRVKGKCREMDIHFLIFLNGTANPARAEHTRHRGQVSKIKIDNSFLHI